MNEVTPIPGDQVQAIEPQRCPACAEKRRHTQEDLRLYHPAAGYGINK